MTGEEFYKMFRDQKLEANKLAREVVKMARERKVSVPMLVRSLCEEHAASECAIAERGAYDCGYDRGLEDGRAAERQRW